MLQQPTKRLVADDILEAKRVFRFLPWQLGSNRHVAKPLMRSMLVISGRHRSSRLTGNLKTARLLD